MKLTVFLQCGVVESSAHLNISQGFKVYVFENNTIICVQTMIKNNAISLFLVLNLS